MKNHVGLATSLLAAAFVGASTSSVIDLTSSNFDTVVSGHDVVMVEFYAPWCEICKELEPIYENAASLLDTSNDIRFARVDCVEDAELCEKYFTPIYPTLRLFQGLDKETIYHGERAAEEMISFANVRVRPAVTNLTKDNLLQFARSVNNLVVAFWDAADMLSNTTFSLVAEEYVDYYTFGATNDPDVARIFGLSSHGVALHKEYDQRDLYYHGSFEVDALANFITMNSIPLIAEYDRGWSWYYPVKDGLPLAAIFAETVEERAQFADLIRPTATQLRGSMRFVTVDAEKHDRLAAKLLLNEGEKRAFVIRDAENRIFRLPSTTQLTEQSISEWIHQFQDGKLKPSTKEQFAALDVSEESVVVLNTETFDSMVLDDSHDVLVEFYAPWCGHCKKLIPAYAKLAEHFTQSGQNVRVAKIDATAEKIADHPITSYPTIKFFPANAKKTPIAYEGDRSVADMIKFLRENSGLSSSSQNVTVDRWNHVKLDGGDNFILGEVIGRSNGEPAIRDEL